MSSSLVQDGRRLAIAHAEFDQSPPRHLVRALPRLTWLRIAGLPVREHSDFTSRSPDNGHLNHSDMGPAAGTSSDGFLEALKSHSGNTRHGRRRCHKHHRTLSGVAR